MCCTSKEVQLEDETENSKLKIVASLTYLAMQADISAQIVALPANTHKRNAQ